MLDANEVVQPLVEKVQTTLDHITEANRQRKAEFADTVPDGHVDYFGGCPVCHGCDGVLNVRSTHWHVCLDHQTKWCSGANLFSSWKDETEIDWEANALILSKFQKIESYTDHSHVAPVGSHS